MCMRVQSACLQYDSATIRTAKLLLPLHVAAMNSVDFFFFEAWRSPAEKTQSLLTLRGSSKDGRYVHFLMFEFSRLCVVIGVFVHERKRDIHWHATDILT